MDTNLLSVIIRYHDHRKLPELQRCLFSLVNSTWGHLQPVVVCQNIPQEEAARISDYVTALNLIKPVELLLLTPAIPAGVDSRSRLLNIGLAEARGRYIAFLDYDDAIYPDAYQLLTGLLQNSDSVIAFGDVAIKHAYVQDGVTIVRRKSKGWGDRNLADLLHDNCCPIHSYVFDRQRMTQPLPSFDETLAKYEDYDFLLQVCMRYPSSFEAASILVGDYYIKEDGSNTVITASSYSPQARADWERSKRTVLERRDRTSVSETVWRQLQQEATKAGQAFAPQNGTGKAINAASLALRRLRA